MYDLMAQILTRENPPNLPAPIFSFIASLALFKYTVSGITVLRFTISFHKNHKQTNRLIKTRTQHFKFYNDESVNQAKTLSHFTKESLPKDTSRPINPLN